MSEKHTAGRLEQATLMVKASDGSRICHTGGTRYGPMGEPRPQEAEANACRIVATWNFGLGFPTQALEGCSLEEVVEVLAWATERLEADYAMTKKEQRTTARRIRPLLHKLKPESGDG